MFLIKIPVDIFAEIDKINLECWMEMQGTQMSKIVLKINNKIGRYFSTSKFTTKLQYSRLCDTAIERIQK